MGIPVFSSSETKNPVGEEGVKGEEGVGGGCGESEVGEWRSWSEGDDSGGDGYDVLSWGNVYL